MATEYPVQAKSLHCASESRLDITARPLCKDMRKNLENCRLVIPYGSKKLCIFKHEYTRTVQSFNPDQVPGCCPRHDALVSVSWLHSKIAK